MRVPTRDNLIVLGLAAAMLTVAVVVIYRPQTQRLEQLQTQITSQKLALEEATQKVAVVPEMTRQVQAMKDRYQDFDRKLPKQQELHEFLRQISNNVDSSQLVNQSIEPGNPTRQEFFNTLPMIMKFQGRYLALTNFLEHLDTMERLSRVQKMILTSDGKSNDLNIELQMNIYFTES